MNQKEIEVLKIEESFRDIIENDIKEKQTENKVNEIKDIKLVGQVTWRDKVNGKDISDNVFIVEKEIIEIDESGKKRITKQKNFYIGNNCIAASLGDDVLVYNKTFAISELDKIKAIKDLLENTSQEDMEKYSMNKLKTKEIAEVLTTHLGSEIFEEEVQQLFKNMDEQEIEEKGKDKEEGILSKKQTDIIKVNGIQKVDLNKKVDGKETLAKRLDLDGYENIYVVYSEKVDDITPGEKRNNTTYSLVGVKNDGTAKVLNDEFYMDNTVGSGTLKQQTKIRANSTATRDNKDLSVYTRKTNGISIGCENDMGNVNLFLYKRTVKENENVGIQIETSKTPVIPMEIREIMNKNKQDEVYNEIKKHTDIGCNPKDVKDFDGDENTATHIVNEYNEIDESDYIPNTNMTWREFANKCGYRGEGIEDIKKAIKVVEKMEIVNEESLDNYIEEEEENFNENHRKR